jgi:hypothetical protein
VTIHAAVRDPNLPSREATSTFAVRCKAELATSAFPPVKVTLGIPMRGRVVVVDIDLISISNRG